MKAVLKLTFGSKKFFIVFSQYQNGPTKVLNSTFSILTFWHFEINFWRFKTNLHLMRFAWWCRFPSFVHWLLLLWCIQFGFARNLVAFDGRKDIQSTVTRLESLVDKFACTLYEPTESHIERIVSWNPPPQCWIMIILTLQFPLKRPAWLWLLGITLVRLF